MATTSAKLKLRFPDVEYTKLPLPEEHPHFSANGFKPGLTILPKGHVKAEGRRALSNDLVYDRDVAIPLRDGIKIYADIFRPVDAESRRVPALIPWSPYGKTGTGPQKIETMGPFRVAIPWDRTSGYEKFEAPDPAEWCERGYAIVNVDARGVGASEGDVAFWGQQEAEDIYDTIDWLAKQPWCNGSVGMVGNSWLAHAQINFASRFSHPALKALAPMEGFTDVYRDVVARGGMPVNVAFSKMIVAGMAGPNSAENMPAMISKRPIYDEYWESKTVKVQEIGEIPLYILASYSTMLHSRGSFEVFRGAGSKQKWLRVHPYQEWYDLYRPEVNDELQRYFDRYCKGIDNGWENDIPPVRLSLLGFSGSPAQTLQKLYLDASQKTLTGEPPSKVSETSHAGHDLTAHSDFVYHFNEPTELAGYPSVRLWMSCREKDDMDVVVQIRKISKDGKLLEHLNYPCPVPIHEVPNVNVAKTLGPQGFLRASHAVSRDDARSERNEIFYTHDKRESISPGTIVPLNITLWPIGLVFDKGEGIMLRVAGHDMSYPEIDFLRLTEAVDENVG